MMMKSEELHRPSRTEPVSPEAKIEKNKSTEEMLVSSIEINENDVLCGRGAFANRHVGNRRFRDLVASYQESYLAAKILEKSNIAASIVEIIKNQDPPGRFLKRELISVNRPSTNEEENTSWKIISDRCAKDKTSQALREKAPEVRQRLSLGMPIQHRQDRYSHRGMPPLTPEVRTLTRPSIAQSGGNGSNLVHVVSAQASPVSYPKSSPFIPSIEYAHISSGMNSPQTVQQTFSSLSPMLSPVGTTDHNLVASNGEIQINDNDVLCGRGGVTNSHIGNRQFRSLVKAYQPAYIAAPKLEKANLAREIVCKIRSMNPPGRFLMKRSDKNGHCDGAWYDVGDEKAREKTSQALREKAPEIRSLFTAAASLVGTKVVPGKSDSVQNDVQAPFQNEGSVAALHIGHRHRFLKQSVNTNKPELSAGTNVKTESRADTNVKRPYRKISGRDASETDCMNLSQAKSLTSRGGNVVTNSKANRSKTSSPSIAETNDNDVLLGRGAGVNYHVGNRRFRELVKEHQQAYLAAAKLDKANIARTIVDMIRERTPSGRFLMKDPNQEGAWLDVGDERAREKTSQALREKAPELRTRPTYTYVPPQQIDHGANQFYDLQYANSSRSPSRDGIQQLQSNDQWMLCNELPPPSCNLREEERGPFLKRRRFGPGCNF